MVLASCSDKNDPDANPTQGVKPVPKGARKINFVVDGAYDLSKTEVHSIMDSTLMGSKDEGLWVPKDYPSAAFFLDNTSGQILAVVQTDTVSEKVLVNAESVAQALLTLVPAYHSLTIEQQGNFERNAKSVRAFQDFVLLVDVILKGKRPIYSTDPAFAGKLVELNSYILKNVLGEPNLADGKKMRRVVKQFKDWLPQKGGGALVNQVHSYVYAEFVPIGGGNTVSTLIDPNPIHLTQWASKPLSELGLKDDYYTVNLNQTHEKATSKNFYELSSRLVKALMGAIFGRMGSESRNDCVAAIAGSIQVDVTATVMELAGGANLSALDMFKKVVDTAMNGVLAGIDNKGCTTILMNRAVIAKAVVSQTNALLKVLEGIAFAKDVTELTPFVLAHIDPVVMSNKMQVYKGKLVPGWVEFKGMASSVQPEYVVSSEVRPVVETKVISSFDEVDLGQFEATWIVTSGNGEILSARTPTNSEGKATNSWKLPAKAGTYSIRADMLDKEGNDMQGSPIRFQTRATDCDPTQPNIPVISDISISCGGTGLYFDISFTAGGPGISAFSGSGYCEDTLSSCYPVRLYYSFTNQPDNRIAYNSYTASLLSGTVNKGVVRIYFSHPFGACSRLPNLTPREFLAAGYPPDYKFQVQLINKCNERSALVSL
ncbi:hypothetical protein GCM10011405_03740 [Rufibacter glacialis]|nr:hypothetical protein GCM10011405_03740 [Rufibacter glacialis]